MEGVYLVTWRDGTDNGVLGIFSGRVKAENAIKEDEQMYSYPEFSIEYDIEYYDLDEVQV